MSWPLCGGADARRRQLALRTLPPAVPDPCPRSQRSASPFRRSRPSPAPPGTLPGGWWPPDRPTPKRRARRGQSGGRACGSPHASPQGPTSQPPQSQAPPPSSPHRGSQDPLPLGERRGRAAKAPPPPPHPPRHLRRLRQLPPLRPHVGRSGRQTRRPAPRRRPSATAEAPGKSLQREGEVPPHQPRARGQRPQRARSG